MARHLRLIFALIAGATSLFSQNPSAQPKRLALLLGNYSYRHLPSLSGVPEEIDLIGAALNDAHFELTVSKNFTLKDLQTVVPAFLNKIQPGDICFFYFDGYTMQYQQDNFLLPVEFDPKDVTDDLTTAAVQLIGIQQNLDRRKAGLKMLVLEASRSDASLMKQGVGLANPDVSTSHEILFAFSARPNQLPLDNKGAFTRYLAAAIRKEGLTQDEVFRDVFRQDDQASYQPFVTQDFFFHPLEKKPEPVEVKPPPPVVITKIEVERGPGSVGHNNRDKEDYVWIPPGTFKMGCVPEDTKCRPEEKPQHQVTISKGFWMGRNEVKTLSYERYVDADKKNRKMPLHGPIWDEKWKKVDSQYPMAELTADEASAYCAWAGGRLPTEAEWEYAARAGESDHIFPFGGTDLSREQANFYGKKGNDKWEQAAPVGSFDANKWNLLDMAGNVWEWCLDKFSKTYFSESPAVDPQGPAGDLPQHVVRGGSWDSDPKEHLRISFRQGHNAGNNVGFRCVLPDTDATKKLLQVQ